MCVNAKAIRLKPLTTTKPSPVLSSPTWLSRITRKRASSCHNARALLSTSHVLEEFQNISYLVNLLSSCISSSSNLEEASFERMKESKSRFSRRDWSRSDRKEVLAMDAQLMACQWRGGKKSSSFVYTSTYTRT